MMEESEQQSEERDEADEPGFDDDFEFDAEYDFEDWQDIPEEEASRILKGLEALIPDIVKRTMGNVLASEEGFRAVLGDKNIPRELAGFLLGQVDATRRGILRIVSREIRVFLEDMDFGGEIAKILTTLSFEVRTEIRFIPNEERLVPSVKNRVRVRRQGDGDEEEVEDEPSDEATESEESASEPEPAVEPRKSPRWTRHRPDKSDE